VDSRTVSQLIGHERTRGGCCLKSAKDERGASSPGPRGGLEALAMRAVSPLLAAARSSLANTARSIAGRRGCAFLFPHPSRAGTGSSSPHAAGVCVVFRGEVFAGFFVLDTGLIHPSIWGKRRGGRSARHRLWM
jgi:hypothetical protein